MGGILTISGNTIHGLANSGAVTTGGCFGIELNGMSNGSEARIYNNQIDSLILAATTTGTARGISMNMATGTGLTAKVYNNMISNLRNPGATTSGATTNSVRGMDIIGQGTVVSTFQVYYNSVMLDNTVPPTSASQRSAGIYMRAFGAGAGTVDLRNNIVNNTMASGASGTAVALQADGNTTLKQLASTTDYNLYYVDVPSASKGISFDATTLNQTLVDHQAAVASGGAGGPRDVNSKSKAVTFVSVADLHLSGGSIGDTDLKGTPVTGYTTDIDSDTRDPMAPYMGADERPEAYLPIQLAYFNATFHSNSNSVLIRWGTISEINNYGFEIQKRLEGTDEFRTLPNSFVAGHGTTNEPQTYSFTDINVSNGNWYYRLKQIDLDGRIHYMEPVRVGILTNVAENTPAVFSLAQNYPNPFNPETRIVYVLPEPSIVRLTVYNLAGQEIAALIDDERSAGRHEILWNGTSNGGAKVASGIYFYRMIARAVHGGTTFTDLKKMTLLK
jgi:hypothetical protein